MWESKNVTDNIHNYMFNFYVSQLHKSWVLYPPNCLNPQLAFVFRVKKPTLSPKILRFFWGRKGLPPFFGEKATVGRKRSHGFCGNSEW